MEEESVALDESGRRDRIVRAIRNVLFIAQYK